MLLQLSHSSIKLSNLGKGEKALLRRLRTSSGRSAVLHSQGTGFKKFCSLPQPWRALWQQAAAAQAKNIPLEVLPCLLLWVERLQGHR